ncbi:unnamed protein product [Vitrella brassicaformis CCMP3155]|uniref:Uncharacterized protein n=2 Tax=Vitrella brassicaformis TaxID=1169539 RepID=A0A0G4FUF3_VITBC|nr:unnamed protein product [Vitrella brassicaformis CCMP3155]|eukprot:CEM18558.1 unnamed protein product [Vitrella brassicaformis CCMP3155]
MHRHLLALLEGCRVFGLISAEFGGFFFSLSWQTHTQEGISYTVAVILWTVFGAHVLALALEMGFLLRAQRIVVRLLERLPYLHYVGRAIRKVDLAPDAPMLMPEGIDTDVGHLLACISVSHLSGHLPFYSEGQEGEGAEWPTRIDEQAAALMEEEGLQAEVEPQDTADEQEGPCPLNNLQHALDNAGPKMELKKAFACLLRLTLDPRIWSMDSVEAYVEYLQSAGLSPSYDVLSPLRDILDEVMLNVRDLYHDDPMGFKQEGDGEGDTAPYEGGEEGGETPVEQLIDADVRHRIPYAWANSVLRFPDERDTDMSLLPQREEAQPEEDPTKELTRLAVHAAALYLQEYEYHMPRNIYVPTRLPDIAEDTRQAAFRRRHDHHIAQQWQKRDEDMFEVRTEDMSTVREVSLRTRRNLYGEGEERKVKAMAEYAGTAEGPDERRRRKKEALMTDLRRFRRAFPEATLHTEAIPKPPMSDVLSNPSPPFFMSLLERIQKWLGIAPTEEGSGE